MWTIYARVHLRTRDIILFINSLTVFKWLTCSYKIKNKLFTFKIKQNCSYKRRTRNIKVFSLLLFSWDLVNCKWRWCLQFEEFGMKMIKMWRVSSQPSSVFHLPGHLTESTRHSTWTAADQAVTTDWSPNSSHHAYFLSERYKSCPVWHTTIFSKLGCQTAAVAWCTKPPTQTYATIIETAAQSTCPFLVSLPQRHRTFTFHLSCDHCHCRLLPHDAFSYWIFGCSKYLVFYQ